MGRKCLSRSIQVTLIGGLSIFAFGCGQNKEQAAPPPMVKVEEHPKANAASAVSTPVAQQPAASKPAANKPDPKDKKVAASKKPSSAASSTVQFSGSLSFLPEDPTETKPAVIGADGIASGQSMFGRTDREMEEREAAARAQLERENSLRQMMNSGMGNNKVRSGKGL